MKVLEWSALRPEEVAFVAKYFSRISQKRGVVPDRVSVARNAFGTIGYIAMFYDGIVEQKTAHVGIVKVNPDGDIVESWETILAILRSLRLNVTALEVYPQDRDIVNTAHTRWFWLIPELPPQYNLKSF